MDDTIWHMDDSENSLVIRTDFAHEDEWTRTQAAIVEPQTEDEFTAYVKFADDRAYEGLTLLPNIVAALNRPSHKHANADASPH